MVGNPNSGKSSLFNCLTGLNQKVGNFPGVTVEKKSGTAVFPSGEVNIIDLPGTYSLYPRRLDEWVSYKVLIGEDKDISTDVLVAVADASNLKRNLLFCTQLIDLKIPVVVALTMTDIAAKKGIKIDLAELERELGVPVVAVNPRKQKGIAQLKKVIEQTASGLYKPPVSNFIDVKALAPAAIDDVKNLFPSLSDYSAIHYLINHESFALNNDKQQAIETIEIKHKFNPTKTQAEEILQRYSRINHIMQLAVSEPDPLQKSLFTEKLDNILLHRKWGYIILLAVLFLLFQSVFWLASYPMDWIDNGFASLTGWLSSVLPENHFTDLLINGLIAGIGGIVIFVPQIAILFALITLLEYTGVPSALRAERIFSFSGSSLPSSPTLYNVAIVPTNTSLAANEVTRAIPIFQS